ncbi:MAG TPA: L,D-transpeptidase family protein [Allosphingosinicella sp.]|nr:L,D-transpeptidase family protein [Allosphingosinicella sp.]
MILGGAAALMLAAAPPGLAAQEPRPIEDRLEALDPGDYVWQPELAAEGPVEIVISLGSQLAYVYRDGTLIGASTVSSGREGYESPVGRFQILEKKKVHRSNRYDDAPMPYMQRLNWYGVALHGGHVPGYPASHGCIRLPMRFAQKLFEITERGGFVFVTDEAPESPQAALELARAHADAPFGPGRTPESAVASP